MLESSFTIVTIYHEPPKPTFMLKVNLSSKSHHQPTNQPAFSRHPTPIRTQQKKRYQPTMYQPTHKSLACASYGHGRSHAVAHILFAAGEPWRRSSWRLMLTEANVQRGTFCWAFLGAPNLGSGKCLNPKPVGTLWGKMAEFFAHERSSRYAPASWYLEHNRKWLYSEISIDSYRFSQITIETRRVPHKHSRILIRIRGSISTVSFYR